jgi:hypothetical protein
MYAITLKQPWIHYILYHGKDVENRTWKLPESSKNQWIALHAGKTFDKNYCPRSSISLDKNQFSAILGFIQFSDCITNSSSEWAIENQYHWVISQKIILKEPIPCKGKLGFWIVDIPLDMPAQLAADFY